jgi:hypothetical protein
VAQEQAAHSQEVSASAQEQSVSVQLMAQEVHALVQLNGDLIDVVRRFRTDDDQAPVSGMQANGAAALVGVG